MIKRLCLFFIVAVSMLTIPATAYAGWTWDEDSVYHIDGPSDGADI